MGAKVTVADLTTLTGSSAVATINSNFDLVADEFDEVLYRDGSQTMQGELDMDSNRIINLPVATTASEPVRLDQLLSTASSDALASSLATNLGATLIGTSNSTTLAARLLNLDSVIGNGTSATTMGTYAGTTIPDNETAKQNLQSLETAVETKANASAVGVTSSAANMGTYTGSTISDNQTAKQNIQELETAVELRTVASALAGATGTTLVGHDDGGASSTVRTAAVVLGELGHSVKNYGAVGDGSTNDYTAFANTLTRCLDTGAPMIIPAGDYLWDLTSVGTALWDVTRTVRGAKRAIKIIGMGQGQTSIHITNATSIAWQIASTTDWFDPYLEGFTIYGSFNFPLLVIGKNDYSDPVNMLHIKDVSVENSNNGSSNEALRLNYIAGGSAYNLRCNAYSNGSGTNTGTALRIRQAEFLSFVGGAAGNADRGVDFTDGVSFGCTFIGQTYENSDYCFSNRSANSGGHTVIGGQFSNVGTYSVYSSASLGGEPITFIGNNYTPAGALVDPANYSGVRIVHSRSVTTPAVPATTVTETNTSGVPVLVYIWGGTVSAITIDGFSYGLTTGTFILQPGSAISITYTVPPTWQWRNMQA